MPAIKIDVNSLPKEAREKLEELFGMLDKSMIDKKSIPFSQHVFDSLDFDDSKTVVKEMIGMCEEENPLDYMLVNLIKTLIFFTNRECKELAEAQNNHVSTYDIVQIVARNLEKAKLAVDKTISDAETHAKDCECCQENIKRFTDKNTVN